MPVSEKAFLVVSNMYINKWLMNQSLEPLFHLKQGEKLKSAKKVSRLDVNFVGISLDAQTTTSDFQL